MKTPRKIIAIVRLKKTEIPQTIISVRTYLPILRSFGVCSSNWPMRIFPKAYMMLTMATSNHSDSVVHILNILFFNFLFSRKLLVPISVSIEVYKALTLISVFNNKVKRSSGKRCLFLFFPELWRCKSCKLFKYGIERCFWIKAGIKAYRQDRIIFVFGVQ